MTQSDMPSVDSLDNALEWTYSNSKFAKLADEFPHTAKTIRTALSRQAVGVEGLRKKILPKSLLYDPCRDAGWNDCLDHLIQQGIIKEGE